jgi:hypothetical protein
MGPLAKTSLTFALVLVGAPAFAAGATVVPAGGGRAALAIEAGASGVAARVCRGAGPCDARGGSAVELPTEAAPHAARAEVRSIALASGKHLGRIDVPGEGDARFVTLVAASADGKAPVVVWRGWTGHEKGEHGEQRTHGCASSRRRRARACSSATCART